MKKLILTAMLILSAFAMQIGEVFKAPQEAGILTNLKAVPNTSKVIVSYNYNDDKYGVFIYDIDTNQTYGYLELNSSVNDIEVKNNYIYLAVSSTQDDNQQLIVADISDVNNIILAKTYQVSPDGDSVSAYYVKISPDGKILALSVYHTGVGLFEINDDGSLTYKSFINNYGDGVIAFSNDSKYLVIANNKTDQDSSTYDLTDITSPKEIDTFVAGTWVKDVLIDNDKLLITNDWDNLLEVYGFENGYVSYETNFSFQNSPKNMILDGDTLYMTLGSGGYGEYPKIISINTLQQTVTEELNITEVGYMELNALDYTQENLITLSDYMLVTVQTQNETAAEEVNETFIYPLHQGWNLVAAMEFIFTDDMPACVSIVWTYDGEWKLYTTLYSENNFGWPYLYWIEKGNGFWVYATEECDLIFK